MATSTDVVKQLRLLHNSEKAAFFPRFFRTQPGEYGEGDKFLGVIVPNQRKIAKQFCDLPKSQITKLLQSKWHEVRLTGLFILVGQFQRSRAPEDRKEIVEFYLSQLDRINNWDLVDASAHKILGEHILEHKAERKILKRLARSKNMWHQRVSVIATFPLNKAGQPDELLDLATRFLTHEHDLIHKAVGWMLREVGKVQPEVLRGFLGEHSSQMPRTMLRYSIEKLSPAERKRWLAT